LFFEILNDAILGLYLLKINGIETEASRRDPKIFIAIFKKDGSFH
jgi:hypothetical protein